MQKVELNYFSIGNALGGSQSWMPDPWMKIGGCAALAAVDSFICFALHFGKDKLCPIDVFHLTKLQYIRFAMSMKPYIPPRFTGVCKLQWYVEGVESYIRDRGCNEPKLTTFSTGKPLGEAQRKITEQIDKGIPIPFLLLNPISKEWKEYHWHWFMLTGYCRERDSLSVKAVTYGEGEWLPFSTLWDSKNPDNGGMILYDIS